MSDDRSQANDRIIRNREADRLASSITPAQLGQAMAQLDLTQISPHRRGQAIRDHLMRIVADTIHDRDAAQKIHIARALHRSNTRNGNNAR